MATVKRSTYPHFSHRLSGLLVAGVLAAGCGDPLVDADYRGPVLFTLRGNVSGASDVIDLNKPVRIAVFWSSVGPFAKGTEGLIEQPSASQEALLPFSFTLNLFDAAPEDLYYQPANAGAYAIAQLLGYPDNNGNQRRDADEPVIGASDSRALIYTKTALTADQSPTAQPIPAGYHLIYSSIPCGPRPPVMPSAPADKSCSVPFGVACSMDAQCGSGGVCIKDFLDHWPQGACGTANPPPVGCGPPAAVRVDTPVPMSKPIPGYWVKACTTDADCGRDYPYQCDLALGACMPTQTLVMQVGDPPMVAPWCR